MTFRRGDKVQAANATIARRCPAPGEIITPNDVHTFDTHKRLAHARDLASVIFVRWANGAVRKHVVGELVPYESPTPAPVEPEPEPA